MNTGASAGRFPGLAPSAAAPFQTRSFRRAIGRRLSKDLGLARATRDVVRGHVLMRTCGVWVPSNHATETHRTVDAAKVSREIVVPRTLPPTDERAEESDASRAAESAPAKTTRRRIVFQQSSKLRDRRRLNKVASGRRLPNRFSISANRRTPKANGHRRKALCRWVQR